MIKLYITAAFAALLCIGIFLFYGWAYQKGYEAHQKKTDSKAVQCLIKARLDMVTAGAAVQKAQEKIERKKTKDEICRDILSFDVRGCL